MYARWLGLLVVTSVCCTELSGGDEPDAGDRSDASDTDGSFGEGDAARHDDASSGLDATLDATDERDASDTDATSEEVADSGPDADVIECEPMSERSCYTGPEGTEGRAGCKGGTQTCNEQGTGYGPCEGQVLPELPRCSEQLEDRDCNGLPDNAQDSDGDGFTLCDGDCCDSKVHGCEDPELINPGAYDFPGDDVDDDCSGDAASEHVACDDSLASNSADAMDYAKAIELCQLTTPAATGIERRWGVISAGFALADGTGTPNSAQRAIRPAFGGSAVRRGSSMMVLSSGAAAANGQTNPPPAAVAPGPNHNTTSAPPADWLAGNDGKLPHAPACPEPANQTVRDSVMLRLTVRVPTNARAFSLDASFFSAEFPEWVCSEYNDYFIALLDSEHQGEPRNPADKNIAVYVAADGRHPLGVNLAYGNTGLFTQCVNGTLSCATTTPASSVNTCGGTSQLAGTGFDEADAFNCNSNSLSGGSTGWLRITGNVVPGEIITLRLAIWDTADATLTSTVLLDSLTWLSSATEPGVQLE